MHAAYVPGPTKATACAAVQSRSSLWWFRVGWLAGVEQPEQARHNPLQEKVFLVGVVCWLFRLFHRPGAVGAFPNALRRLCWGDLSTGTMLVARAPPQAAILRVSDHHSEVHLDASHNPVSSKPLARWTLRAGTARGCMRVENTSVVWRALLAQGRTPGVGSSS